MRGQNHIKFAFSMFTDLVLDEYHSIL